MPTSPTAPRRPEEVQKPQQRPAGTVGTAQPVGAGAALAAGTAAGAAGRAVAATPALLPIAGAAVTVEAVRKALDAFFPKTRLAQQRWLASRVKRGAIPGATQDDMLQALTFENELQGEFERRVRERVMRDVGSVIARPKPEEQREALRKLFERERRYAQQRAVEMGRRLEKTTERIVVRRESPRGAFWALGVAREHTPECVAMAGKFWSWEAIEGVFRPPVGPGCRCSLKSEKAAIAQGLLAPGQTPRGLADAQRVRILYGNHHGVQEGAAIKVVAELREAIIRVGLADEETADQALARWLRDVG